MWIKIVLENMRKESHNILRIRPLCIAVIMLQQKKINMLFDVQ